MKYLCPTSTISLWPRQALVFDSTLGWQFFDRADDEDWKQFVQTMSLDEEKELGQTLKDFLTDHPVPGEATTPAQAVRTLDARYNGWLPELPMDIEQYAGAVALWNQKLRITPQLSCGPMSLPGSAGRLAHLLVRQSPKNIYFDADPNGLAFLITHSASSSVRVTCEDHALRLHAISEIEESTNRVKLLKSTAPSNDHDFALGYASTPSGTLETLERMVAHTAPGSRLALVSRRPHDHWLNEHLKELKIDIKEVYRDLDTWLIPEGFAVDHTADLLIFERPNAIEKPALDNPALFNLQKQPYTTLDANQLGRDRLTKEALCEVADLVDGMGPHSPCHRHIQVCPKHLSLSYYDEKGFGFVLDMRPEPAHASITFMPYHPMLERAAIHAVFLALAGPWTRLAAERTWWSGADSVFT